MKTPTTGNKKSRYIAIYNGSCFTTTYYSKLSAFDVDTDDDVVLGYIDAESIAEAKQALKVILKESNYANACSQIEELLEDTKFYHINI